MAEVKVYRGDSRLILPTLGDKFRAIVSDPPYGISSTRNQPGEQIVNDDNPVGVVEEMLKVAIPRLLPDAHVLLFCHWRFYPALVAAVERVGLKVKGQLIWDRMSHGTGDLDHTFATSHDVVIHATQGHPVVTPRIRTVQSVQRTYVTDGMHPHTKPVELLKRYIESTTNPGDMILDPFAGSGTTMRAAHETGRGCVSIEIDERWFPMLDESIAACSAVLAPDDASVVKAEPKPCAKCTFLLKPTDKFCPSCTMIVGRPVRVKGVPKVQPVGNNVCLCGCGTPTKARFASGHDSKFHSLIAQIVQGKQPITSLTLTDPVRSYLMQAAWVTDGIKLQLGILPTATEVTANV